MVRKQDKNKNVPNRQGQNLPRLLILGVVFHIVYSWSIFDIYFRSPLVHGMTPVDPVEPAPASRLVLFVADGLRADKLFENKMAHAPFLKTIVTELGSWGISRTHVPTESRPGHVALIAGFYEDVSAVTHGWKTNPVEFDSLFNESRKTWSWGSPDILPMFSEGASDPNRVESFMYPPEYEDFGDEDKSKLDTWVFDKVDEFFAGARKNATTLGLLQSDKIVFFLHLLGLDSNGHAHRPYSKEYLDNIELVDKGIAEFVRKFEDFYDNDGRSVYVFSADHGMSNRGNHGDGHPENTETPLIVWGAGVAKPNSTSPTVDSYSLAWGLEHLQRHDVNQADVAPLMSTLVGLPYPMNSVGELPLSFLENTDEFKAEAAFKTALQILRQFLVKQESKRRTELYFVPFPYLVNHESYVSEIQGLIERGLTDLAITKSVELARRCVDGLRYYQTYDWLFLRGMISVGYLGWIANSLVFVLKNYGNSEDHTMTAKQQDERKLVSYGAFIVFLAFSAFMYLKESHPNYYFYVAFLVYLWSEVFKERNFVLSVMSNLTTGTWFQNTAKGALYVFGLEILVYSYFRREILTPALIVMGFVWPLLTPSSFREKNWKLLWFWSVSCFITSIFTMLPVEYDEDMRLVTLGGVLIFTSGVVAAYLLPKYAPSTLPSTKNIKKESDGPPFVILLQLAVVLVSIIVVNNTSGCLARKEGLPIVNQLLSWIVLASCGIIPIMDSVKEGQHYLRRLVVIYLSFAPLFILLSISYETLFYFCFSQTLLGWLLMERQLYSEWKSAEPLGNDAKDISSQRRMTRSLTKSQSAIQSSLSEFRLLTSDDLRTATIFLFLINIAFFGTGNIASVSSFSIESVYRFVTIFDPFLMGILLIIKIIVPFFLLSAVFGVISRSIQLPAFSLFLLVLSTTDVMTLNFFFLVRDDGSWLEIGTTISHYIIASTFIVFQIILFSVGHSLVGKVLIPDVRQKED